VQPGELVVKRVRWSVDAECMGFVVAHAAGDVDECLVMWTMGDQRIMFKWHLTDALMAVDTSNVAEVRGRCDLGS